MAQKQLWNTNWRFSELPVGETSYQIPKKAEWNSVDIPHDWMIYQTHALYRDSIGWYKKEFTVEQINPEQQTLLRFDGVYMDTTVYVNGQEAGEWKYGYSTFEIDMTPFLVQGKNEVHVRVVYQFLNTRWYSGAGIYRNVWFINRNNTHIASDGIYVTPKKENDSRWTIEIDTEIEQTEAQEKTLTLKQSLFDFDKKLVVETQSQIVLPTAQTTLNQEEKNTSTVSQTLSVENPRLWDIAAGNLYELQTELWQGEVLLEAETQNIGFRTLTFLTDEGFFINGRHEKLNGVCEHHDFGCLGAAFNKAAMKRKFLMLRDMGVNAVRTSHNMPAPELIELADEMGFLILSEAFDMWERSKTTYDYGRFFNDWYERDVTSWIRRDRNHPSVIMWSIGNEIPDTLSEGRGEEITRNLFEAVRRSDPKQHAPVTIGSNFIKWENPQKGAALLDCVGYNYSEYLYEEHHKLHQDWVIYGSETASVLASRGIYHFPRSKAILSDTDEQCSALGNTITGWGAKSYEDCICDDRDAPFSLGQFLWTGFDYLGESTPYQTKNSYFGQIDTAGFPKDSFYIFQSAWTDYKEKPMVHLFPYWDFNEGQRIDVQACTNAPTVELFVNGISCGAKEIDHKNGRQLVALWQVPYTRGTIKAVAYDENGAVVAEEEHHSFLDAVELTIAADRSELLADGRDLAFITIEAKDKDGYPVENARNRVHVEVTGAGRLIGLDNGDSADFDEHKGKSRRLFGGKLLAVVATKQTAGEIRVIASSEGMKPIELILVAKETAKTEGIAATEENQDRILYGGGSQGTSLAKADKEIPIRKIELTCTEERHIISDASPVAVQAKIYPENATYRDLDWKVVTDTGIEVNFATLSVEGTTATLIPQGDGEFRLRCSSKNGGFADSVQSSLEFSIEGMGTAAFNPYQEICTGLCDERAERVAEGVEHGVNFLGSENGKADCYIGFLQMDFGSYGSDKITVSVFANTNDPVQMQLWEGKPGAEESILLSETPYHKAAEWMVFKEETFHLKKRLKGITSFYLATKDSYQLKSFWFEKTEKAYALLAITENDYLYGDAFTVKEEKDGTGAVEQIGNNVTIAFTEMEFGAAGANKIQLLSRSPLQTSTIQLRYKTEEETKIQAIEVPGSAEYTLQSFEIEPLTGTGTVEFIFMPGSNFDWKTVQFIKTC